MVAVNKIFVQAVTGYEASMPTRTSMTITRSTREPVVFAMREVSTTGPPSRLEDIQNWLQSHVINNHPLHYVKGKISNCGSTRSTTIAIYS